MKITLIVNITDIVLLSLIVPTSSIASSKVDSIHIVTESWDKYTNADGSGLFLDITRANYEPKGIKINIEYFPYNRALHSLKHQGADATFGTYSSQKEGKPYIFTPQQPIDKERTVVIFKDGKITGWKGQDSLVDGKLAWVRGYDYHENLSINIDKFIKVRDSQQGLKMLAADRFDFFLDHYSELSNTIGRLNFDTSTYQIESVFEENIYMAFTNTERGKHLAHMYDEGFSQLKFSGELKEFFSKYEIPYPFN